MWTCRPSTESSGQAFWVPPSLLRKRRWWEEATQPDSPNTVSLSERQRRTNLQSWGGFRLARIPVAMVLFGIAASGENPREWVAQLTSGDLKVRLRARFLESPLDTVPDGD